MLPGKEWLHTQERLPISERYLTVLALLARTLRLASFNAVALGAPADHAAREIRDVAEAGLLQQ